MEVGRNTFFYVPGLPFFNWVRIAGQFKVVMFSYSAPGEKKPFMSVNGEWNGIMYASYGNQSEPEVFVDTFNMPIVKKQVQSVGKQREFESRRYVPQFLPDLISMFFHHNNVVEFLVKYFLYHLRSRTF